MRVLLDENMDRRLKQIFDDEVEVSTVVECGWSGKQNGELLRLAEAEFDAFITMDQGIEYQQNLSVLNLGVILIKAPSNRRVDVAPLMPAVNQTLEKLRPGEMVHISA